MMFLILSALSFTQCYRDGRKIFRVYEVLCVYDLQIRKTVSAFTEKKNPKKTSIYPL